MTATRAAIAATLTLCLAAPSPAAEPTLPAAAVEFFEAKVRPLLAENCFSCHGPKKQMAGLRLDSRQAMMDGGDNGPALMPGDADKSKLVKAVRHDAEPHMPPKGKLRPDQVEALTAWVKMGAPWPADAAVVKPADGGPDPAKHWAFQPVRRPELPAVKGAAWPANAVDRFVLAKLEEKGLAPSKPADKRTLLRRVTYDLTGLPPTPAEVDAFLKDESPNAYAKVVERLLASPHYGERWARYWLDLARYSDTKGYVFQEDRNYPFAYAYRDWVVRSLNEDLPYDRFVTLQLAADRLDLGGDKKPLAAMGFLTVGRRFLNNQQDIIDDRIDVVSRTFQGLTVTCARCHDHKFDPIPTKDYYSLYGVFASSVEPKDPPVLEEPKRTPEFEAFEAELKKREAAVREFVAKRHGEVVADLRKPEAVAKYLLAAREFEGKSPEDLRGVLRQRELSGAVLRRWMTVLGDAAKKPDPLWAPWLALAKLPDKEFAEKAPAVIGGFTKPDAKLNPLLAKALAGAKPTALKDLAELYGKLLAESAAKPDGADRKALAQVLLGENAPTNVPVAQAEQLLNRADRNKQRELQRKVDEFRATAKGSPVRAMVLNDAPTPTEPQVFVRGNPNNRGERVPRQFLKIVAGPDRKPFTQGSGRLELAQAVASPTNPLTARVMVNRVWAGHFGKGLVGTASDFGLRSDPPTHPELLDWLATEFIGEPGALATGGAWSLKKLHRSILLSRTYQQSSDDRPELTKADPENRLLGRMDRRRLDWEALRDSLLAASGKLDLTVGGPAVNILSQPFAKRRTLYGFIDRQNLPGTFRSFDFALPDTHSPQRFTTTVPQQALFLLNSPFVVEQAKGLAARPELTESQDPVRRIERLYRLVYGRSPTQEETGAGVAFVSAAPAAGSKLTVWEQYAQVLLLSNEFAFVD